MSTQRQGVVFLSCYLPLRFSFFRSESSFPLSNIFHHGIFHPFLFHIASPGASSKRRFAREICTALDALIAGPPQLQQGGTSSNSEATTCSLEKVKLHIKATYFSALHASVHDTHAREERPEKETHANTHPSFNAELRDMRASFEDRRYTRASKFDQNALVP